jgi:phosphate transport system protein
MRTPLERGQREIERDILALGAKARDALIKSVKSLKEADPALAEEVLEIERETDIINLEIEKKSLRLSATQQPVARDLRFLAVMMKIASNFERIADMAGKIAGITHKTKGKPLVKPLTIIPKMAEKCAEMIDLDLEAIRTRDTKLTEALGGMDDVIDAQYGELHKELLGAIMKDPTCADDATDLLFVAIYLERAGDIAAKTGARIVYMVEGRKVWIK